MRKHGTSACYAWGPEPGREPGRGCRCDLCREARSEYDRQRKQRVEPAYVGADEVRRHLRMLQEHGIGWQTVSKRSGVSNGVISKILYGCYATGRGPCERVRPATRDKILAVMPSDAADDNRIDATRTHENIATLLQRGWTKRAIARVITDNPTANGLQIRPGRKVHARTARAVEALLDQPVPPRRSRHGEHPVPQPVEEERPTWSLGHMPRVFDLDQQAWRRQSACRLPDVPVWMFFPSRGDNETVERAKAVCATCPVAAECLEANLTEEFGIFGGTSENQRREIRRQRGIENDDEATDESEAA